MMDLRELYQEVILDHNRRPRNRGRLADPTGTAEGHNPLCGDMVTVTLRTGNGRVEEIAFEGAGCAVSTASASLMTGADQMRDPTLAHPSGRAIGRERAREHGVGA